MCSGYSCSKSTLAILNILYMLVALIMIGVAGYALGAAKITSVPVVGGIIACGVFLLLISIIGLVGALKHHQVLLFFYMIILFLLFILQFAIAIACLAMNKTQQEQFFEKAWKASDHKAKVDVQLNLDCCGFNDMSINETERLGHPSCVNVPCCMGQSKNGTDCPSCEMCWEKIEALVGTGLHAAGGVGLFFSFTEIVGCVIAFWYRKQSNADGTKRLE